CPFIKKQYNPGAMQTLQKYAESKGVIWLTIVSSAKGNQGYVETNEEANAIWEQMGSQAASIILDHSGDIGHTYNATNTPHMFVIDTEGKLAYMGAIDDNEDINVLGNKNYVFAAIDEL